MGTSESFAVMRPGTLPGKVVTVPLNSCPAGPEPLLQIGTDAGNTRAVSSTRRAALVVCPDPLPGHHDAALAVRPYDVAVRAGEGGIEREAARAVAPRAPAHTSQRQIRLIARPPGHTRRLPAAEGEYAPRRRCCKGSTQRAGKSPQRLSGSTRCSNRRAWPASQERHSAHSEKDICASAWPIRWRI